jgi:hypothetical protein
MSKLITESRIYKLTGLTPILGSAPASRAIRTQYIASKAPTDKLREEEEAASFDLDEKGLTVFNRNRQDQLCLMGYQIKGFLKGALTALKAQLKIAAAKGKIDNLVFVEPRYIPLIRDGQPLRDEDEILERPLRAQTMQGERVTLAASELVEDPWEITIEMTMIPNAGTAKSEALSWDAIEAALDYGAYHGLGQWRNADYGRFIWEREDA